MNPPSRPSTSHISTNNSDISLVTLPQRGESESESTTEDSRIRNAIWGHFFFLSYATFQVIPLKDKNASGTKVLLHYLPNIISALILLARLIYMFIRMIGAPSLTESWAYSNCLFFFALHGFVACLLLALFKSQDYFETTVKLLRVATRDTVSYPFETLKIMQG